MLEPAKHLSSTDRLFSSSAERDPVDWRASADIVDHATLATVWRELRVGASRLLDVFVTDDRCYAVMVSADSARPGARARAKRRKRQHLLEAMLLGASQKRLGIEADQAVSTIGMNLRASLEMLGIATAPSKFPLILVIMARACARSASVTGSRSSVRVQGGASYRLISIARPEIRLASRLSTAEYAVARYLIEGKTYGEMAALRGTSIRTVANQICSMFRKLGVSGRAELAGLVADIAIEGDDSFPRSQ